MKLSDFKGLFKKSIATIESIENPFDDYYIVKLKPSPSTRWAPGEHAIFKLPEAKVEGKKWRAFSIASVTSEGHILLGMRTGKEISSFKKALINSKKGTKVKVTGPFGWFKVQDATSPIVMVAGGVGITPIRALLKQLESDTARPISLVYAAMDNYLFGEELEGIAKANPQITLIKTSEPSNTTEEVKNLAKKYGSDAWYFVSGSQGFISGMKATVTGAGVKSKKFINDPFLGY
jgi:ferredoxin-NADP reductase